MSNKAETIRQMKETADLLPCGIGLFALDTSAPVFLNKAYYRLIGYTEEEYRVHSMDKEFLMFPQDLPISHQSQNAFEQSGAARDFEYRIVRKDGEIRWVKLNISSLCLDGESYAYASFTDITKEKETYSQLITVMENTSNSVSMLRISNGRRELLYANEVFFAIEGVNRAEYVKNVMVYDKTAVTPEDYRRLVASIRASLEEDCVKSVEYQLTRPSGERLWIRAKYRAIKQNAENTYLLVSVAEDITVAKEENIQLRLEQHRFQLAMNEMNAAVCEWNLLDGSFYSSAAYHRYALSRENNRDILHNRGADDLVYPDDREAFGKFYAETGMGQERAEVTLRLKLTDGSYRWCRVIGLHFKDEHGAPAHVVGIIFDVDEEHKHSARMNKLVDRVPGGIGIYEIDNGQLRLTYLNNAYYAMLGAKRDERLGFYGANVFDAVCDEDRPAVKAAVQRLIDGEDQIDVLHRVKNGSGQWVWLRMVGSVVERRDDRVQIYAAITDVDEMVRTQQKMAAARKKEELILSALPGAVAVYRMKKNGRLSFDYVSQGLAKMCGYDDPDAFFAGFKDNVMDNVAAADVPGIIEAAEKSMETHTPFSAIFHLHTKNGPDILNRLDATMIADDSLSPDDATLWYAIHTLVSEDSKLALQEQQRYRNLVDTLDIALFEWERDTGFYVSEKFSAYALSEQPPEKILRNSASRDVVHPHDLPRLHEFFHAQKQHDTRTSVSLRMKMRDGSYRWTEMLGFYEYDAEGKYQRIIGVLRDMDKERIEQNDRLRRSLEELQQANHAKADFYSRMSHDMRTPMNGILGLSALAQDETDAAVLREDMKKIRESGQYLLSLINDTLDIQRIESGKMALEPKIVSAIDIVNNILDMIRTAAQAKGVKLVYNAGNVDLDWYIRMDEVRLKQIFVNLLSNAVKFTPAGGTVELDFQLIKREGMLSHDVIRVRDTGVGMSESFLRDGVFKPFSQENNVVSTQYAGSGLGLSIAKSLVEMMHGKIEVESELGVGTTFTVYLDFERVERAEAIHTLHRQETKTGNLFEKLRGKRILLAEDHPLNAEIAKKLLEKSGCVVTWQKDGRKAVDCFAASPENTFALVLMDVRMPVMDGLEATKAIRALPRADSKTVPILAMTANAYADDVKRCLDAGMNDHLAKPVEPQRMYETIARYLA